MVFGFAYLLMVIAISAFWLFLAVIPKPRMINDRLDKLKDILRPYLNPKRNLDE